MKKVKIQSLKRADSILEALFHAPGDGWRLQDVVEITGLKPVTALSLLQTLVALRLAEQVGPRGRYRLGTKRETEIRVVIARAKRIQWLQPQFLEDHGSIEPQILEVVARTGEQLLSILDEDIRTVEGVSDVQSWLYTGLHYKPIRPRGTALPSDHDSDIQMV